MSLNCFNFTFELSMPKHLLRTNNSLRSSLKPTTTLCRPGTKIRSKKEFEISTFLYKQTKNYSHSEMDDFHCDFL